MNSKSKLNRNSMSYLTIPQECPLERSGQQLQIYYGLGQRQKISQPKKSKKQGKLGSCIGNSSNSYISVRGGLFIIFKKAKMKKNHSWSGDEDKILYQLALDSNLKNCWTKIAEKMNRLFPENRRFPKQCRDRFINYLREEVSLAANSTWSHEETCFLLSKYKQLGSKWTQISKKLPGKSQNCVKNKFYGTLRKAVRDLNLLVFRCAWKQNKKQVKLKSIMKILEYAEGKYRKHPKLVQQSNYLRDKLLRSAANQTTKMPSAEAIKLITEINEFNIAIRSFKPVKKAPKLISDQAQNGKQGRNLTKEQEKSENSEKSSENECFNYQGVQHSGSIRKQNREEFFETLLKEQSKQHHAKQNKGMIEFDSFQRILEGNLQKEWGYLLDSFLCYCPPLF